MLLYIKIQRFLTAIAMAMADSVTVSMGEEMRGVFKVIFLVRAEVRSWKTEKLKFDITVHPLSNGTLH